MTLQYYNVFFIWCKLLFLLISRDEAKVRPTQTPNPSFRGSEATLRQHLISHYQRALLPKDMQTRGDHLQPNGNPAEEWKSSLKSSNFLEFQKYTLSNTNCWALRSKWQINAKTSGNCPSHYTESTRKLLNRKNSIYSELSVVFWFF